MAQRDLLDRFWSHVDTSGGPDACWPWRLSLNDGYGQFHPTSRSAVRAHRFAYEATVAPVPEGSKLDHRCHNGTGCKGGPSCPHRRCCNPAHLEPTTNADNLDRSHNAPQHRDRCPQDHEYTPENTYRYPRTGKRKCRACDLAAFHRRRAARRLLGSEQSGGTGHGGSYRTGPY